MREKNIEREARERETERQRQRDFITGNSCNAKTYNQNRLLKTSKPQQLLTEHVAVAVTTYYEDSIKRHPVTSDEISTANSWERIKESLH